MYLPFANALNPITYAPGRACVTPTKVRWNLFITAWTGGTLSENGTWSSEIAENAFCCTPYSGYAIAHHAHGMQGAVLLEGKRGERAIARYQHTMMKTIAFVTA